MAGEEVEKLISMGVFGKEISWQEYIEGLTQENLLRIEDMLEETVKRLKKIKEQKLKAGDKSFFRYVEEIFDGNRAMLEGVMQNEKTVRKTEGTREEQGEEGVRIFRIELIDDKGRTRYFFRIMTQKFLEAMAEEVKQGRVPQMPGPPIMPMGGPGHIAGYG